MEREIEFWKFAASKLKQNQEVILLVVAESTGSSPGRQGFKMFVAEDGLVGSIGGGVMEIRLVEIAKEDLKDKSKNPKNQTAQSLVKSEIRNPKSKIVEQVHRKNSPNSSGMICSGKQTIIFYKLNLSHLKTVGIIINSLENNQPVILCISNAEFDVSKMRFDDSDFQFKQTGEHEFVYREKLGFKNNLYIVGGGHCALALSELVSKMDFRISLFDDRADLNTLVKNRFVQEKKILESYAQIGDFIPSGANVYVVVMTLGYIFDELVIRKLIDKDFKYFGVLGSRAKMKTLLRNLEREGFPKEQLNKIRTPIGLPINSRTPEEIAVSIAAEIIAVKNAKS
ncbi:MAG TPA: XdhC family protein [Pyrinomonadaceae bacterium]|jgi:xanthine dehydrogenase accessory factor